MSNFLQVNVTDSLRFLSIVNMVALNLRLNRTVTSQADTIRMYNNHVAIIIRSYYYRSKGKGSVSW